MSKKTMKSLTTRSCYKYLGLLVCDLVIKEEIKEKYEEQKS